MKFEAVVVVLLLLILVVAFVPEAYRRWRKSSREDEREGIENERLRRSLESPKPAVTSGEETPHHRHVRDEAEGKDD